MGFARHDGLADFSRQSAPSNCEQVECLRGTNNLDLFDIQPVWISRGGYRLRRHDEVEVKIEADGLSRRAPGCLSHALHGPVLSAFILV